MRRIHRSSSHFSSAAAPVAVEQLEARQLLSVSAVGGDSTGVAKVNKQYVFATFTTTDSPLKLKNYSAKVAFDDGTPFPATAKIKLSKGVFSVVASHKYLVGPETFAPEITITDQFDGTSESVQASIQVKAAPNHSPFTQYVGSLTDVLENYNDGTWTQTGNNYRDGSLTAVRISDRKDIVWSGNIVSAVTVYSNSAPNTQQFGYFAGNSGGSYQNLFSVTGDKTNAVGFVGATSMPATYRLGRTGSDGVTLSSNPAGNSDGLDHMITFQIAGLKGLPAHEKSYLVCWDTPSDGVFADYDYDDLDVMLTLQK
jgi:hypothetical protein